MAQYDGVKNQPVYLFMILASASPGTVTMGQGGTVYTPVCPSVLAYQGAVPPTLNGAPAEWWAILPVDWVAATAHSAFLLINSQTDSNGKLVEPGGHLCTTTTRPAHTGIFSYNMSTGRLLFSTPGGWIDMPTGAPA